MKKKNPPEDQGQSSKTLTCEDIYSMLVFEAGISPGYLMDEMPIWEISVLLKNFQRKERVSWEQTRFIAYVIAQGNSTKRIKPNDILAFPWDEKKETAKATGEDRERLRERVKETLNYLNNGRRSSNKTTS